MEATARVHRLEATLSRVRLELRRERAALAASTGNSGWWARKGDLQGTDYDDKTVWVALGLPVKLEVEEDEETQIEELQPLMGRERLPGDVLLEIARQCQPSQLRDLVLLSSSHLRLFSPMLYHTVLIPTTSVCRLFDQRDRPTPLLLSLFPTFSVNLIQHLTLSVPLLSEAPSWPKLDVAHLGLRPFPRLQTLCLQHTLGPSVAGQHVARRTFDHSYLHALLFRINPKRLVLTRTLTELHEGSDDIHLEWYTPDHELALHASTWTHLEDIMFIGGTILSPPPLSERDRTGRFLFVPGEPTPCNRPQTAWPRPLTISWRIFLARLNSQVDMDVDLGLARFERRAGAILATLVTSGTHHLADPSHPIPTSLNVVIVPVSPFISPIIRLTETVPERPSDFRPRLRQGIHLVSCSMNLMERGGDRIAVRVAFLNETEEDLLGAGMAPDNTWADEESDDGSESDEEDSAWADEVERMGEGSEDDEEEVDVEEEERQRREKLAAAASSL